MLFLFFIVNGEEIEKNHGKLLKNAELARAG